MEGNILYRYSMNQIEMEGNWGMSSDINRQKFSYLFLNKNNFAHTQIDIEDINFQKNTQIDQNYKKFIQNDKFNIYICNANVFEALLLPHEQIFKTILNFLSGEYHGFFVYFSKTIEDKFTLNFQLEDNQVRVSGRGSNNLGQFSIIGFVNFFTMKEQLLSFNKLDSDVINFGMIKISRIYHDFDSQENTRVIKSYQHSRKIKEDNY